ncbi:MAG: hypothetical protein WDO18_23020 [Acidobacteriota bacterium]
MATALWAQEDLVALKSPDGRIEIRLFNGPPASYDSIYPHLAYQIDFQGKRLMDTSYLGFDIDQQLPLGHKLGLLNVTRESTPRFTKPSPNTCRTDPRPAHDHGRSAPTTKVSPSATWFRIPPTLPSMRLAERTDAVRLRQRRQRLPLQLRDFRTAV